MELDEWPRGWASFQNRWINDFSLTVSGQSVTLSQSPKADTGGTVWDAGIVLCKYLESLGPRVLREKKVCAVYLFAKQIGVASSDYRARFWMWPCIDLCCSCRCRSRRDRSVEFFPLPHLLSTRPLRPDMVERLRANVKQNMKRSIHRITVRPYSWGTPITDLPPCDIVLGSDITYFDGLHCVLVFVAPIQTGS